MKIVTNKVFDSEKGTVIHPSSSAAVFIRFHEIDKVIFDVPDDYILSENESLYTDNESTVITVQRFLDLLGVEIGARFITTAKVNDSLKFVEKMMDQRDEITLDSDKMALYFNLLIATQVCTSDDVARIKRNELPIPPVPT